jgi:HEPN domain-containing protein
MDEASTTLAKRWLTKAKRDLLAARKLSSEEEPYLDIAIYHCQQAAEKAVKGYLVFHEHRVKKTHNISVLIEQAAAFDESLLTHLDAAERLTPYAEEYRYPDEELEPSVEEFLSAFRAANDIYQSISSRIQSALLL